MGPWQSKFDFNSDAIPAFYSLSEGDAHPTGVRSHIALIQLDADISHPEHGPSIVNALRKDSEAPSSNFVQFVDMMIKENGDLWDKMIHNKFCAQMALGTADRGSFNWYMVQDLLYLKNWVYWKLGYYSKAPWSEVLTSGANLTKSVGYYEGGYNTLVKDLNVPPEAIDNAVAIPIVQAYCDYLINTTITEDWFSIHVSMIPCVIGYDTIATNYDRDPNTKKDTDYYKYWIKANIGSSSPNRYREFLDKNFAEHDSKVARAKWKQLFRKSCQMEIDFWEACLTHTLKH